MWRETIDRILGGNHDVNGILDLGDHLSDIFRSTAIDGRTQGGLSVAGTRWEALVCWYCNLCLLGSRTVVIKMNRNLIPDPILDSLAVIHDNTQTNSESDLVAITFPAFDQYRIDRNNELQDLRELKIELNTLTERNFRDYEVGIIQCKTNWNDDVQRPMLWNMIYHARDFADASLSIGRNNFSMRDFNRFTYSFVTVPTNDPNSYGNTHLTVLRARTLSGGNYWGRETSNGIALSIKEIFNVNFRNGQTAGLRDDLTGALRGLRNEFAYFNVP